MFDFASDWMANGSLWVRIGGEVRFSEFKAKHTSVEASWVMAVL
jgi:hypothetical protein